VSEPKIDEEERMREVMATSKVVAGEVERAREGWKSEGSVL
jgi:hypothetical protein